MNIYKIQAITIWNLLSSNYLLSGQNKKGSIFTVKVLFLDPRQFSESATRDTRQLYTLSLFTSPEKCFRKQKKKSFLLSALPHCRIFSKSTATREWLPCIVDILKLKTHFFEEKKKKNGVETMKPEFSMDTLNETVDNAKSSQRKRFQLHSPICRRSIS